MEKDKPARKGPPKNRKKNPVNFKAIAEYVGPVAIGFGLSKADLHWGWWVGLKPRTKAFLCAVAAAVARYFKHMTAYGAFAGQAASYIGHGEALRLIAKVKDQVAATASTAPKGGPSDKELKDAADREMEDVDDVGDPDEPDVEDIAALSTGSGRDVGDADEDEVGNPDDDEMGDPDDPDLEGVMDADAA